jgi:hypothetical protein
MGRWMAIVALLLGLGFTAFESFNAPTLQSNGTVRMQEGGSWPPPPTPAPFSPDSGYQMNGSAPSPADAQ